MSVRRNYIPSTPTPMTTLDNIMLTSALPPMDATSRWSLVLIARQPIASSAPMNVVDGGTLLRKKSSRHLQMQTTEYKVLLHMSLEFVDDKLAGAFDDRTSTAVKQFCAVINIQVGLPLSFNFICMYCIRKTQHCRMTSSLCLDLSSNYLVFFRLVVIKLKEQPKSMDFRSKRGPSALMALRTINAQ